MPTFPKRVIFKNCRTIKQTDNALLVEVAGNEVWIPQSQIDDDSEVYGEGHSGELIVSEWIATQKGLV